jgi:cellobiose phosphorylase
MCNSWLPYQAIAGRLFAKCAYYQQGGAYGYRDQLQDSLMLLDWDPAHTLLQLGRHAEAMYEDGGVRHWWHPGTDIFVRSHHSDTCLWLAFGVLAYLETTNDTAALDEDFAFLSRETEKPSSHGTLWAHCLRGIDRTLSKLSPRGLPLLGAGDWNDGLSHAGIEGIGESVWLAMFLFDILTRWQPFLEKTGQHDVARKFADAAVGLKQAVNDHAWDGEWYIAGTRDDGKPFGSHTCEEGKIFLNPQTWAVISGIAPPERVEQAMNSVRKHLLCPFGALLLQPAYSKVDPYIGYITRYAPGLRENGGVYSHASTWAIKAFTMIDDQETALAIYRGMLPPLRAEADVELYAAEPYVMPGNVDGPDSPYKGRAGWTWYTGSAAWMVRVARLLNLPK